MKKHFKQLIKRSSVQPIRTLVFGYLSAVPINFKPVSIRSAHLAPKQTNNATNGVQISNFMSLIHACPKPRSETTEKSAKSYKKSRFFINLHQTRPKPKIVREKTVFITKRKPHPKRITQYNNIP